MDSTSRVVGREVKGVDDHTVLKTVEALQGDRFGRKRDTGYFDTLDPVNNMVPSFCKNNTPRALTVYPPNTRK
jgi:hypothetical protein